MKAAGCFRLALLVLACTTTAAHAQWTRGPATHPRDWLLAFVDVETTGLVPGKHEMIDLGVIYTDLEGNELDRLFMRITPRHPERTQREAVQVNGFSMARWDTLGAISPDSAASKLIAFHDSLTMGRGALMVALNSQFDAAFLHHFLRDTGYGAKGEQSWRRLYHYYVMDIPSMAWSLGYRELTGTGLSRVLDVPDEPHNALQHNGLNGAALNLRLYRALLIEKRRMNAGNGGGF